MNGFEAFGEVLGRAFVNDLAKVNPTLTIKLAARLLRKPHQSWMALTFKGEILLAFFDGD